MPLTRKNPRDPDSPFLTVEAIGKGVPFRQRYPHLDPKKVTVVCVPDETSHSRSRVTKKKARTSVALASDVVTELQATGPKWPELADRILRAGLKKLKQKAA